MNGFDSDHSIDRENYFSQNEVAQILGEQLKRTGRGTTRPSYGHELNYALMSFAFITGARASEICSVTVGQLQKAMKTGELKIIGKGAMNTKNKNKIKKFSRNLIVPNDLRNILMNFVNLRNQYVSEKSGDFLFIGHKGNPITRYTLYHKFKTCCRQAGVEEKKLHSTRHTAGMLGYAHTKDVLAVKKLLGHKSISSTMVYVKASDESVKALSDQLAFSLNINQH